MRFIQRCQCRHANSADVMTTGILAGSVLTYFLSILDRQKEIGQFPAVILDCM